MGKRRRGRCALWWLVAGLLVFAALLGVYIGLELARGGPEGAHASLGSGDAQAKALSTALGDYLKKRFPKRPR